MKKNRIMLAVTLVGLMSGGMALAADDTPTSSAGPAPDSQIVDVSQEGSNPQAPARFRARHDQPRDAPPVYGPRPLSPCSDNPLTQLLANLYGMKEIMRPCDPTE